MNRRENTKKGRTKRGQERKREKKWSSRVNAEMKKGQGQNRKCKRKRRKMGQREEKWAGRRKERK
jgi:hypothetical protein